MVSRHFEIHALAIVLVAVGSFIFALVVYTNVQVIAQERLVGSYVEAKFEKPFCDSNVALDGNLCSQHQKMSGQQIHALLAAANVIDVAEIEDHAALEVDKAPVELRDLLETLRSDDAEFDETALGFIGRLAKDQCIGDETSGRNNGKAEVENVSENINGEVENKPEINRSGKLKIFLARALADSLDGDTVQKTNQTENENEIDFSRSQRLKEYVYKFFKNDRCDVARKELETFEFDPEQVTDLRPTPSGWRFSTARCLSDTLILGRLLWQHSAISPSVNSEASAGYNLGGDCAKEFENDPIRGLKRLESYTTLMKYVLGQTHAEQSVRYARKIANLVRGPEHVGILTLIIMTTILVLIRWITLERRFFKARSANKAINADKKAMELKILARTLAIGGEGAEREREALNRGRVLLQWGLATIPAIGFIGTVRGILEALAKTGDVVWANDRLERAEAIAGLAGELGLAFSTTFFALLASIIFGLIVILARVREGRCLDRLAKGEEIS